MRPANGNANPNSQPMDKGWFCPSCGAADVTGSALAGGDAKCNICTWTGKVEEFATFRFTHDMGSPEEVFRNFFLDVRKVMSRDFAIVIGQLLIKWGLMEQPDAKNHTQVTKVMNRYLGVIAKAIVAAIIKERQMIEKEKHGEQPSA